VLPHDAADDSARCVMTFIQIRPEDIVIQRRIRVDEATHAVRQLYAVTAQGHDDHDTEYRRYGDALRVALELAEARGLSVWYEENPQSGRRTFVMTFRQ
jgi:hypothetical protein